MSDLLELVWIDPKCAPRVRKQPAWKRMLEEAPRVSKGRDPDEPAVPNQDIAPDDRRDVFLVVARAEATGAAGFAAALAAAVRDDGKFAPPLRVVAGELRLPFDEIEALKVAVTTATPFTSGDEPLKAAVDGGAALVATPDLITSPAVAEMLLTRILEAFGRVRRAVPQDYLSTQIDRALLEKRRYQACEFGGRPHVRALLEAPGEKTPMLVYLPADSATQLPLYSRFPVRLVVAAHPVTDQFEPQPFALEGLALARVVPAAAVPP